MDYTRLNNEQRRLAYLFTDPDSPAFNQIEKAQALAGLTDCDPAWIEDLRNSVQLRDGLMIRRAETAINQFIGQNKPTKTKLDASKFVLERLHRKKYGQQPLIQADNMQIQVVNFDALDHQPAANQAIDSSSSSPPHITQLD
jgi:hypothetical protein